ncbi:MAG: hypothetical protein KKH98_04345 [Spirochaetes bacterium]|nr:hypothetical protein [Spirochaetota bacterium]
MWKKVLLKILKYSAQILLFIILIAFLAKSGNTPAVFPKAYVEKIVEYTDRTLIAFNLIRDEKLIKKYAMKKQKSSTQEDTLVYNEKHKAGLFNRIYNFLFMNNYEMSIVDELNKTAATLNQYIDQQLNKLKNIIGSTFVNNIINEKELNINNEESYFLLKNMISGFKNIEGFYIVNDANNVIAGLHKEDAFKLNAGQIINKLDNERTFIDVYEYNNKPYFIYLLKSYQKDMNILFLLDPAYFNIGFNNINVAHKVFLFNRNYKILNSNIQDEDFEKELEGSIRLGFLNKGKTKYKIKNLKLRNINLYAGILFEKYPTVSILLNILKLLVFLGVVFLLFVGWKFLYKKVKDININRKPSQLELVTGALMEVAKSIKTVVGSRTEKAVTLDASNIEKLIAKVSEQSLQNDTGEFDFNKIKSKKKESKGWKLIEPN